jgi:hypothetical protein
VYDGGVGPGYRSCFALRFDSPDDVADLLPQKCIVGALRQSRRSPLNSSGGFAVNARVERKFVMGRMNWSRIATRNRMRRQGVEDVKGGTSIVAPLVNKQPRRKLSKGELRQQTAAAFLAWRAGQTSKNK